MVPDKSHHDGWEEVVVDSKMVVDSAADDSVEVVELTVEVVHGQEVHAMDTEVTIDCLVVVVGNV